MRRQRQLAKAQRRSIAARVQVRERKGRETTRRTLVSVSHPSVVVSDERGMLVLVPLDLVAVLTVPLLCVPDLVGTRAALLQVLDLLPSLCELGAPALEQVVRGLDVCMAVGIGAMRRRGERE